MDKNIYFQLSIIFVVKKMSKRENHKKRPENIANEQHKQYRKTNPLPKKQRNYNPYAYKRKTTAKYQAYS